MTSDRLAQLRPRLERMVEMLRGARAEVDAGRYNNAVNRGYYACFHIGAALRELRGDAMDPSGRWEHRRTMVRLERILDLTSSPLGWVAIRERADYGVDQPGVGATQAEAERLLAFALTLKQLTATSLPWTEQDDVS